MANWLPHGPTASFGEEAATSRYEPLPYWWAQRMTLRIRSLSSYIVIVQQLGFRYQPRVRSFHVFAPRHVLGRLKADLRALPVDDVARKLPDAGTVCDGQSLLGFAVPLKV